jgi:hypothetical protein
VISLINISEFDEVHGSLRLPLQSQNSFMKNMEMALIPTAISFRTPQKMKMSHAKAQRP